MSAELPNVSKRLEQLESRLQQAKEARDNYIEFLKQNRAQSETIQNANQIEPIPSIQSMPNQQRPSLMRRLETGQYFWNFQNQSENYSFTPLPTNEPVPGGMALNSDMNAMTKRLREISASIRNMRDYRLSMPSDEYFRSVRPHLQNSSNFSNFYGDSNKADLSSLAEIRSRILNMQFNVEKRTRELLDQRHVQRPAVQITPALITDSTKPPEWLRQKELEDELKRLSTSQFERNIHDLPNELNEFPSRPSEAKVEPPRPTTKAPEPRIEEKPVISSNRQIIFGLSSATKSAEVEKPEPSKDGYNKMLDILRPKQLEVSSSDDSDTPLTKQQVGSGQQGSDLLSGTKAEAPPPPKPLPSFLQTQSSSIFSTPTRKPSLSQTLAKPPNLDDSDSDFFK